MKQHLVWNPDSLPSYKYRRFVNTIIILSMFTFHRWKNNIPEYKFWFHSVPRGTVDITFADLLHERKHCFNT